MEDLLPRMCVPAPDGVNVDPAVLFPAASSFQLEIGFGGGEHLAWQAQRNPSTGFIGAEPFINGVAKLLSEIDLNEIDNIRIHHGDARPLIEALPENCFRRIYVLHPDPWPKKRHHKRRIISPWFLEQASRLLVDHGELRVASDIPDYIRWTLMHVRHVRAFEWQAECVSDWMRAVDDWPQTRYEAKAIREGRKPTYLAFRRGLRSQVS